MGLYRRQRRQWAGCLILLLLFVQAATAAYACPQLEATPAAHGAMPGCDETDGLLEMDAQHPLLCIADCEQDARVPSQPAASELAASAPLTVVALAPAQLGATTSFHLRTDPAARGEPPPGSPPTYLLHGVLRN